MREKCGAIPKLGIMVGSDLTLQCCSPAFGLVAGTLYPVGLWGPVYKDVTKGSLGNLDADCLRSSVIIMCMQYMTLIFFNRCFKALQRIAKNILL